MNDKPQIIIGIIAFLVIFSSPLWINFGKHFSAEAIDLEPSLNKTKNAGFHSCIYNSEYMRKNHMSVLNEWRQKVVRENQRFLTIEGKPVVYTINKNTPDELHIQFEMSLNKTCMKCHESKQEFCDKCHNYLDVVPYCWDCHVRPEEVIK